MNVVTLRNTTCHLENSLEFAKIHINETLQY
jgi:hypothetical protein